MVRHRYRGEERGLAGRVVSIASEKSKPCVPLEVAPVVESGLVVVPSWLRRCDAEHVMQQAGINWSSIGSLQGCQYSTSKLCVTLYCFGTASTFNVGLGVEKSGDRSVFNTGKGRGSGCARATVR